MFNRFRNWINTRAGAGAAATTVVLGGLCVATLLRGNFGTSAAAREAAGRVYVCAETGKTFAHTLRPGDEIPILSPHSGKPTGYEAEACYWAADGGVKDEPTWVLLNRYRGSKEATFCPDCGRLVVQLNPPAQAEVPPPPTRQEYAKTRAGRKRNAAAAQFEERQDE